MAGHDDDRPGEVPEGARPGWLEELVLGAERIRPDQLSQFLPPADGSARHAAVLMLFGEGPAGPDVLLTERSHDMRSHAAQVSFPGGACDPHDRGPEGTALREAQEETGVDPAGVDIVGRLPDLFLPVGNYAVTPVLGWWREPSEISVVDPAEVHSVHRVPVADLLDPANRYTLRHPSGFVGPAFVLDDLFVWGFTGGIISRFFAFIGWEKPWDEERYTQLPDHMVERLWRHR
jgi:8-oxo-dGTP pyrophosphatase MutT (NUDIX family)